MNMQKLWFNGQIDLLSSNQPGYYYLASEVDAELDTMNLAVGYFHEENDRFITRIAELEQALKQREDQLRAVLDLQRTGSDDA